MTSRYRHARPPEVRRGVSTAAGLVAVCAVAVTPAHAAIYAPVRSGGAPVRVCLVDTGVPAGTPGVIERTTTTGSLDPTDPHGAEMVDILRRAYAPAQVVSVQRDDAQPTSVTTASVIDLCVARGTSVITMSFTLRGYSAAALQAAVDRARASGVVLVAAAGNDGAVGAPADVPGVIGVGAQDPSGRTCPFSSASPALIMGPGCDVPGMTTEGTSDATAYVAGVAAARIGEGRPAADVEAGLRAGDPALSAAPPAHVAPGPTATRRRTVRFRVLRLRGHRVRVRVVGRRAGESLFVRVAGRDRRASGAHVTVPVGAARHLTVSLVGSAGVVARRRVAVR